MKIIITGIAGMIGSYVTRELVAQGHQVVGIDNLWRGKLTYIENISGFEISKDFYELDLSSVKDIDAILKIFEGADCIIHLADIVAGIGYVFNNEYSVFRQNLLINSNVISLASKIKVKKFLYVGTACSFPMQLQNGIDSILDETMLFPANPESSYGWSKLLGTLEMEYAFKDTDTKFCTFILHNVYGRFTDCESKSSQVIPSLISKTLKLKKHDKLLVWGNGEQSRSFIHAEDVAKGIKEWVLNKQLLPDIIQIGPEKATKISELALLILEVCGKDNNIQFDSTMPTGDFGRSCDFSIAKKFLKWEPNIKLKDGLKDLVEWIKNQEYYKK